MLNRKMQFSVIEQLPKEKTQLLGTAELALYPHFFRPAPQPAGSDAQKAPAAGSPPTMPPNTVLRQWVPLLAPGATGKPGDAGPEVEVEIQLSRPVFSADTLESGNIMTLKIEDMVNLPDDWTLKEGNDKDPQSSMF
jgi:hypothetical protein